MVAAGNEMPLPAPKPAAIEVAKQDGKGKAEHAGARAATDGRSMPLAARKQRRSKRKRIAAFRSEAGRQRQGGARRFRRDGRPADAAFAGAENEYPRDRNQEAGRQGRGGVRQLRRERIGQAYAVACSETEGPGDRSQEAGRQSQSGGPPAPAGARPAADAVAGAEIEDPGDRNQETGRQKAQRSPPASARLRLAASKRVKPSRLGIRALTISVTRPMAVSGSSVAPLQSENPAGGKRGFQIRLLGVRGELGQPPRAHPCLPRGCFRRISSQRIWFRGLRQRSRPAFRSLWLESGTHGDIIEPARARDLRAALVGYSGRCSHST